MADSMSRLITMREAAALFGWKKPSNTTDFLKRTGLKPIGLVGRASVYDEQDVRRAADKYKADKSLITVVPHTDSTHDLILQVRDLTHELMLQMRRESAEQYKVIQQQLNDVCLIINALKTETGAGYNVVADELNKIKLQLVEFAPTPKG
jgi:hypothetical protein